MSESIDLGRIDMRPVAKNDVTGAEIKTRVPSDAYREGWERIFGKEEPFIGFGNEREDDTDNGNDD